MDISGLHLSFIGIGMYKFMRRLTGSYPVGGAFGILFLILYILMIGPTVSAVRALVMFLLRVGADMSGRVYDAPTALSAAVVVLLWRPLSLYNSGFWLSFGAVLGILAVTPVVQESISVHTLRSNGQKKTKAIVQEDIFVCALCSTNVSDSGSAQVTGNRKGEEQSSLRQNREDCFPSTYLMEVWGHVWKVIFQGLTASIGINLVIFPILLYYFYEFPLYSFVLNLFVIPLMSVLLFLGMAGSLFALWFVPVSTFLFRICGKILWIYEMSCEITLRLPGARLVIGQPDMWQIVVYYGILFLGLSLFRYVVLVNKRETAGGSHPIRYTLSDEVRQPEGHELRGTLEYTLSDEVRQPEGHALRGTLEYTLSDEVRTPMRHASRGVFRHTSPDNSPLTPQGVCITGCLNRYRRIKCAVVFMWVVAIVILVVRFGETGKLTTVVLDVGQGDGIFMKGPEGNTYLVDGGSSDVKKMGQYRVESFLKSQGVGKLDYVMISHGDSDHMNGVEELIERQDTGVKIGTLVLPVKEVWDEALTGLARKAVNYGIRVVVIETGQSIREGDMTITCIQPGNMGIKSEDAGLRQGNVVPGTGDTGLESGNGASMVLAVRYGEFDMLLTGDVEGEGEKQLTKQLEESCLNRTWEILKVAHHGSKNSSTEEFLRQVQPAYALISAGQENRYGHPHQETVKRLADVGSKIYSTQENGAIIIEVEDGEILSMEKWQR